MPVAMPAVAKVVLRFQEKQILCCHPTEFWREVGSPQEMGLHSPTTNTRYAKLPLKSSILVEYPGLQVNTGDVLKVVLPIQDLRSDGKSDTRT